MRHPLIPLLAATVSMSAYPQTSRPAQKTDEEKAMYSLGVIIAKQFDIQSFEFTDKELEQVKAGLADGARDRSEYDDEALRAIIPALQELQGKRSGIALKREKEAGAAFATRAAGEAGARKTASGMVYKPAREGTGASPQESDIVVVHYEGRFPDGKVFDSSRKGDGPATFPLNQVIPCWTEGVQLMKVGGTARFVCPPDLAYGDQDPPMQMRAGATLIFDVELLDIVKLDEPEALPPAK